MKNSCPGMYVGNSFQIICNQERSIRIILFITAQPMVDNGTKDGDIYCNPQLQGICGMPLPGKCNWALSNLTDSVRLLVGLFNQSDL